MFDTVLIANRGEIACRVAATLRRMGIRSVAVFSDADAGARHIRAADTAVRIGPAPAAASYLDVEAIMTAVRRSGARAVHPGYGFLSENTGLADACLAAGVTFIGPPVSAIAAMGDKIAAKATVAAAGVPVVPGLGAAGMSDADVAAAAHEVGFPVLLKPSAGGGGKGMRLVRVPDELPEAIGSARREARGAFGDDTLLVERYVEGPRHIEIQVFADTHGNVIHLGERECSLQRRHQKVVEEAPSALLTEVQRAAMGASAVDAARAVGYVGAGTVEFIVGAGAPADFFFMEMNTRLQVEHPVTELVTGLDLVEWQVRVAAGEALPLAQADVSWTGHAVEARVYAEDPEHGFLPSAGTVLGYAEPAGAGVRVDSGIERGSVVGTDYDPLLAKVIGYGADRPEALRRLSAALEDARILGLRNNLGFLARLVADPDVAAGRLSTGLIESRLAALTNRPDAGPVLVAAAMLRTALTEPLGPVVDPFDIPGGWRVAGPAWVSWRLRIGAGEPVEVRVRGRGSDAEVLVAPLGVAAMPESAAPGGVPVAVHAQLDGDRLVLEADGVVSAWTYAVDGDATWLTRGADSYLVRAAQPVDAETAGFGVGDGSVLAPMPGTVTLVEVAVGEQVNAGQRLIVVEAMKMEHVLTAPVDGVLTVVRVRAGQSVAMDDVLAVVSAADSPNAPGTFAAGSRGVSVGGVETTEADAPGAS